MESKLVDRYQLAIYDLLAKVRSTQREVIEKAGAIIAEALMENHRVFLGGICHYTEHDLLYRGGGPIFYKPYKPDETKLEAGDVLVVSSVSGRTVSTVNLAYDSVEAGVKVIAFTSMAYATAVDPVHSSGKKLYEIADVTLDNCAPAAEAMLDVDGIEAKFAAASGIASDYIMWSITAAVVEKMLAAGHTPGILKSNNFPGGMEYNEEVKKHFESFGY